MPHEGRERYAYEQRMLALVRHGLETHHPHPNSYALSDDEDNNDEYDQANVLIQNQLLDAGQGMAPPDPKRPRLDVAEPQPSTSSGTAGNAGDQIATSGGGAATDENTAGGMRGGQGTFVHDTAIPYVVPMSHKPDYTYSKVFVKTHKLMSYALASKILKQSVIAVADVNDAHTIYYATTSLAEIPVDILVYYLTPGEFALLPNGAYVEWVDVVVFQRNVLVQFETTASTSKVATLNQNKTTMYAIGLNKTGYGNNMYANSFTTTSEPMIPTDLRTPIYKAADTVGFLGIDIDLYGSANVPLPGADAAFIAAVPKWQFGLFSPLPNYFCLSTYSEEKSKGGWPKLDVIELDAADFINKPICHYHHKFKLGYIKPPLEHIYSGLPYNYARVLPNGVTQTTGSQLNINQTTATGKVVSLSYNAVTPDVRTYTTFDLYQTIEKSQNSRRGINGELHGDVQPSLHVGARCIPSIGTDKPLQTNSSFTDARAEWHVTFKIKICWREHTDRPLATVYNVAAGDQIFTQGSGVKLNTKGSTYAGKYTQEDLSWVNPTTPAVARPTDTTTTTHANMMAPPAIVHSNGYVY